MLKYLITLTAVSMLAACTSKAPDCADPSTQKLAIEQVNEKIKSSGITEDSFRNLMRNYVSSNLDVKGKISDLQFALEKITPAKYDKDIDKHFCKANLISSYAGEKSVVPINYTSQKIDAGKQHFVEMTKFTTETIGELMSPLLKDNSKEQSELKTKLRSQIGDENIDGFIEKNCNGIDQDKKQCEIGRNIAETIREEDRVQIDKIKQAFLSDRKNLVETYNGCVVAYKKTKEKGVVDYDSKKANPTVYLKCQGAEEAVNSLGIPIYANFREEIKK